MALQKTKTAKGVDANYWMISSMVWNKTNNRTNGCLSLYLDKNTRVESLDNSLFSSTFEFEGAFNLQEIYGKIKESQMTEKPYMWDELHPDEEFVPVETNWFVDALDI